MNLLESCQLLFFVVPCQLLGGFLAQLRLERVSLEHVFDNLLPIDSIVFWHKL